MSRTSRRARSRTPRPPKTEQGGWKRVGAIIAWLAGIAGAIFSGLQWFAKPPPTLAPSAVQVQIGSQIIGTSGSTTIYLGAMANQPKAAYLATYPLVIRNHGQGTISRITVTSKYPAIFQGDLFSLVREKTEGSMRRLTSYESDYQIIGNNSIHVARCGPLDPEQGIGIDQPLGFHPTEMRFPVDISDTMRIGAFIRYGLRVEHTVQAINAPPQAYSTEIVMLLAQSEDDLRERVADIVIEQMRKEREAWPIWKKWIVNQRRVCLRSFSKPEFSAAVDDGDLCSIRFSAFSKDTYSHSAPAPKWGVLGSATLLIVGFCLWMSQRNAK